ncbi:MAG: hypothetical protein HQK98_11430 [Nitrospirae bacterium]|nr:hypothetical protein [Nitrospirota bacterium]
MAFRPIIKESVSRKELIEKLELKVTQVTVIVSRGQIFKSIVKYRGSVINYTYNQACLVYIGCELLSLGMAFRYVDDVLISLSGLNFLEKGIEIKDKTHTDHRDDMLIAIAGLPNDRPMSQEKDYTLTGTDIITGEQFQVKRKQSDAVIRTYIGNKTWIYGHTLIAHQKPHIIINLWRLILKIDLLFT